MNITYFFVHFPQWSTAAGSLAPAPPPPPYPLPLSDHLPPMKRLWPREATRGNIPSPRPGYPHVLAGLCRSVAGPPVCTA